MKNIITAAFFIFFLAGCAPGPEAEEHRVIVQPASPELSLNKTERWQTDDYTDLGIRIVQETARKFDGRSLSDYNSLGKSQEVVLLQVFKNTTLQGEAKDMLYVLLMPVAQDVQVLKGKNLEEAMAAQARISARLELYETYFK